uniref:Uncharacterized protein n=1 Tax=Anopheles atroparvus TaxID=41427 RepID=A0A182ILK4_ANOAO
MLLLLLLLLLLFAAVAIGGRGSPTGRQHVLYKPVKLDQSDDSSTFDSAERSESKMLPAELPPAPRSPPNTPTAAAAAGERAGPMSDRPADIQRDFPPPAIGTTMVDDPPLAPPPPPPPAGPPPPPGMP